jgi:hypothetical protein
MNIIPPLPPWTENAVLIYGPRKGGTTLLQNLHDGSNELFVYPTEMKLKFFLNTVWQNQPAAADLYSGLSIISDKQFPNFDHVLYRMYAEELQDPEIPSLRELIMRDIYCVYRSTHKKPSDPVWWCVKDVGGPTKNVISFWRQLFLKSKVVTIVRDPLMVTRSVIMDRRRKRIRLGIKALFREVIDPIKVLYHQAQLTDDKSIHFVVYEKLVKNPSTTMQGICDYLGIHYNPIFEYPTVFGEKVVTATSSVNTTEVFRNEKKWHQDLTLREKTIVWSLAKSILFVLRIKAGQRYMSYCDVVNRIENR